MKLTNFLGISLNQRSTPVATEKPLVVDRRTRLLASEDDVTSLGAVYRALSILSTGARQLPLYSETGGMKTSPENVPAWLKKPSLNMSTGDFISALVLSMAVTGNAYFLAKGEHRGSPAEFEVLDPNKVTVSKDERGHICYSIGDKTYSRDVIGHCALYLAPGALKGKGPLQMCETELSGALNIRNFTSKFFDTTGQPSGILSADADLTDIEADRIMMRWNNLDPQTGEPVENIKNPARIKVLPKPVKYQPINISPRDAQWIEARQFDTTGIARIFGIPSSLMLAAVDGTSMTYQNIEQEWISFARYTLAQYTSVIEDELSRFVPSTQRVKFNFEGLLRSDTLSRYQAHSIALDKGFMTIDEVREIEGLPPLKEKK